MYLGNKTGLILFLFLSIFMMELSFAADSSTVEFTITVHKNYQAEKLIMRLFIETEDKEFSVASDKSNVIINRIKKDLEPLISKSSVEFSVRNYNSFPVSSFFKDYYKLNSIIEIIITNKESIGYIFHIIKDIEEIKNKSFEFIYQDKNEIQNELVQDIAKVAEKKVKTYEESFHVKLELQSFNESIYQQIWIDDIDVGNTYTGGFGKLSDDSYTPLTTYPEKKFSFSLKLIYKMLK